MLGLPGMTPSLPDITLYIDPPPWDCAASEPAPMPSQGCDTMASGVSSAGVTHGLLAFLGGFSTSPGSLEAPSPASSCWVQGAKNSAPLIQRSPTSPPPWQDLLPGAATHCPTACYSPRLPNPSPCLPGTWATQLGAASGQQPSCRQLPCDKGFLVRQERCCSSQHLPDLTQHVWWRSLRQQGQNQAWFIPFYR